MLNKKSIVNTINRRKTDRDVANPHFSKVVTLISISIAIIISLAPPRTAGVTKKPIEIIKTKAQPAIIPGKLSGKKMRIKVRKELAPKVFEAIKSLRSIPFIVANSGSIMIGTRICTIPIITALVVKRMFKGSEIRPKFISNLLKIPFLPIRMIQENVRTNILDQRGRTIRISKMFAVFVGRSARR